MLKELKKVIESEMDKKAQMAVEGRSVRSDKNA